MVVLVVLKGEERGDDGVVGLKTRHGKSEPGHLVEVNLHMERWSSS